MVRVEAAVFCLTSDMLSTLQTKIWAYLLSEPCQTPLEPRGTNRPAAVNTEVCLHISQRLKYASGLTDRIMLMLQQVRRLLFCKSVEVRVLCCAC